MVSLFIYTLPKLIEKILHLLEGTLGMCFPVLSDVQFKKGNLVRATQNKGIRAREAPMCPSHHLSVQKHVPSHGELLSPKTSK